MDPRWAWVSIEVLDRNWAKNSESSTRDEHPHQSGR